MHINLWKESPRSTLKSKCGPQQCCENTNSSWSPPPFWHPLSHTSVHSVPTQSIFVWFPSSLSHLTTFLLPAFALALYCKTGYLKVLDIGLRRPGFSLARWKELWALWLIHHFLSALSLVQPWSRALDPHSPPPTSHSMPFHASTVCTAYKWNIIKRRIPWDVIFHCKLFYS